jgi:hypothetical protein
LRLLVPADANQFTTLGGAVALFLLVFIVDPRICTVGGQGSVE